MWDVREHGVLVRYCDDLVVMCSTRRQAQDALARLKSVLAGLGLEVKATKTRIVHLTEGKDAEGFDFLGFHRRSVRARGTVSPRRVCSWPAGPRARRSSMPTTDSSADGAEASAAAQRMGRTGSQPVPARLGRLFPVREFRPSIRCDQSICPGTVRGVCG